MADIVLIPGGGCGGWYWKKLLPFFSKDRIFTPTLTGLGERKHLLTPTTDIPTHVRDIVNTIFYENLENVILVGHSYGGFVGAGVCDLIPEKIKKMVYLDALVPHSGENVFDLIGPELSHYFMALCKEYGEGWYVPIGFKKIEFPSFEDTEWFNERLTPHPIRCFSDRLILQSKNSIKQIYINCTQSSMLNEMYKRALNENMTCYDIDSGHFPMITHPEELYKILQKL